MIRGLLAVAPTLVIAEVRSETVDVKYRGPVDLKRFECRDTLRSSFIQRVCYDKPQSYMIINLKGTYYHYCELPPATFDALVGAPSMGQFYNQNTMPVCLTSEKRISQMVRKQAKNGAWYHEPPYTWEESRDFYRAMSGGPVSVVHPPVLAKIDKPKRCKSSPPPPEE
jgi:hypothetical protein